MTSLGWRPADRKAAVSACIDGSPSCTRRLRPRPSTRPSAPTRAAPMGTPPSARPARASSSATSSSRPDDAARPRRDVGPGDERDTTGTRSAPSSAYSPRRSAQRQWQAPTERRMSPTAKNWTWRRCGPPRQWRARSRPPARHPGCRPWAPQPRGPHHRRSTRRSNCSRSSRDCTPTHRSASPAGSRCSRPGPATSARPAARHPAAADRQHPPPGDLSPRRRPADPRSEPRVGRLRASRQ